MIRNPPVVSNPRESAGSTHGVADEAPDTNSHGPAHQTADEDTEHSTNQRAYDYSYDSADCPYW
jgi:hypothetical protein